ncbi:hypothetical protein [Nostoc sp.]|uniref:hypothetical protein n=1 Tax=Nostoc sp. TaxID=1180 RepID=UPI002FF97AA6
MTKDPPGSPVTHGGNPQDRTGSPMTNDATCFTWGDPKIAVAHKGQRTDKKNG